MNTNNNYWEQKSILITGASSGIGRELAMQLSGYKPKALHLLARNKHSLEKIKLEIHSLYREVDTYIYVTDLMKAVELNFFIETFKERSATLDVLINNAGYLVNRLHHEQTEDDMRMQFEVNYFAPAFLMKGLYPLLKKSEKARVINITSMGGFQGSTKFPGLGNYSASKSALAILTECLATEWQNSGISVNALAFGSVNTEMLQAAFPGYKAPISVAEMADFVCKVFNVSVLPFNGKVIPVALTAP